MVKLILPPEKVIPLPAAKERLELEVPENDTKQILDSLVSYIDKEINDADNEYFKAHNDDDDEYVIQYESKIHTLIEVGVKIGLKWSDLIDQAPCYKEVFENYDKDVANK